MSESVPGTHEEEKAQDIEIQDSLQANRLPTGSSERFAELTRQKAKEGGVAPEFVDDAAAEIHPILKGVNVEYRIVKGADHTSGYNCVVDFKGELPDGPVGELLRTAQKEAVFASYTDAKTWLRTEVRTAYDSSRIQ
ncbi:MAG: hypothetical protein WC764_01865 [Candidatus Paceibacterota bacterium]|jgi:hypothetical protein